MEFNNTVIGSKIAYYRNLNKLTQKQLADKLKKSPNYISNLERGFDKPPSLDLLSDISDIFNISLDKFLSTNLKCNSIEKTSTENDNMTTNFNNKLISLSTIKKEKTLEAIDQYIKIKTSHS